jgi:ACT domain-containing protein
MRAVITVIGKDRVGIIASISNSLARCNVNILDISQTIMQDVFTMVTLVDLKEINIAYPDLVNELTENGKKLGLTIMVQREDIFNSMHRI